MVSSPSALLMAAFSRSMIGRGVAAGARMPSQELELVARDGFGDGRQAGQHGRRLHGAKRDGFELAASDLAEHGRRVLELHLNAARNEVDQRRPGAAIGDMGEIDAGQRLEQLRRKEVEGADARGAVADRARLFPRALDQIADRGDGKILVDDQHGGTGRDLHDRREVAQHVIGDVLLDVRVDGDRRRCAEQRGAIGRRFRGLAGADRAAGAADVLNDDRGLQLLLKRLAEDAGDRVGAAAGRERNDQPDRTRRIILRPRSADRHNGCKRSDHELAEHFSPPYRC